MEVHLNLYTIYVTVKCITKPLNVTELTENFAMF